MTHATTAVRSNRARPAAGQPDGARGLQIRARGSDAVPSDRSRRIITAHRLSIAAAPLILVGGYVHLCLYWHGYLFIPKIGIGFLLQAGASAVLAAALVVRRGRIHLGHRSVSVAQLTRLAGIGLSLGTLAALGVAHTPQGLFEFREIGLQPAPQTIIAIVAESFATLLLGLAVVEGCAATRNRPATAAVPPSVRLSSRPRQGSNLRPSA